jgi:predicted metal-binding protein
MSEPTMSKPVEYSVAVESFTDSQGHDVPCERYETVIDIGRIVHGPEFRTACEQCPRYGRSLGCPPHGPTFEEHAGDRIAARVVCLRVPVEIANAVDSAEAQAQATREARAFLLKELRVCRDAGLPVAAGGACTECDRCAVSDGQTICPRPQARIPSLSALGVNVIALVRTCFGIDLDWGQAESTCTVGAVFLAGHDDC